MALEPAITLSQAKAKLPPKKAFAGSDLMSEDKLVELRIQAQKSAAERNEKKQRLFDEVDAFTAEIVARFGYEVYQKWNQGEIEQVKIEKWIYAERARDKASVLNLEAIIMAMVGSCIKREPKQPKPKGPGIANKIYQQETKIAKGEM